MFERLQKIGGYILLTGCFFLCLLTEVRAQSFEAQSAADFARSHGGAEYADVIDKAGNYIICGNKQTMCSKEQICLKCRTETYEKRLGFSSFSKVLEEGKCVSRASFNADKLHDYWPDCRSIDFSIFIGKGTGTGKKRILTIEATGFINQSGGNFFSYDWQKDPQEFTDANQRKYTLYVNGSKPSITYAGESSYEGCEVLPVKIYNLRGCFFCPLARLIFQMSNHVTAESFARFAAPLKVVAVIVFAIWLALAALRQVFSATKQDAPKFISAILRQGFKFAVVFVLLSYPADLFSKFVVPVLDSGLKLGSAIMNPINTSSIDEVIEANGEFVVENNYYNIRSGGQNSTAPTLYERVEVFLTTVQAKLSYMQAIGTSLVCVGSHEIITINWTKFKNGIRMMFVGTIITIFAFLLVISFAFYFLDAILELAIIGVMMPLMIAGWPFKATSQYAAVGLKMLLNVFFVMFFTGFVVSINYNLIDQSLSISQEMASSTVSAKTSQALTGFDAMAQAMNEQNVAALHEASDIGGIGFLILAFACLFGFKIIKEAIPLANKMSPGFSSGIPSRIGTMAASTVKGITTGLGSPVGKAALNKWHDVGGVVGIIGTPFSEIGDIMEGVAERRESQGKSGGKALRRVAKTLRAPKKFMQKVHQTIKENEKANKYSR